MAAARRGVGARREIGKFAMADHLSYIRIYGLTGEETEVFQSIGAPLIGEGSPSTPLPITPPGTQPTLPDERESVLDVKALWTAQSAFIENLAEYLNGLDPLTNTAEGSLIKDYVKVLTSSTEFQASLAALGIQKDLLDTLPKIWETISRQTPKELQKWIDDGETYATDLGEWWTAALDAAAQKKQAEIDLADAVTPEEIAAAQEALASATSAEAAADSDLPATNPVKS